jgi:hypothetical protein
MGSRAGAFEAGEKVGEQGIGVQGHRLSRVPTGKFVIVVGK